MEPAKADGEPTVTTIRRRRRKWSPWPYIFGVVLVAYGAAFTAVIAIGAGYTNRTSTPTPVTVALVNVAAFLPTQTPTPLPPTATPPPPTPTPMPPTVPPSTPTPEPNVDFRVPLANSNTGVFSGQRVSITNITDGAQAATASARPVAGYKFVTVDVQVENLGDAPVTLGAWRLRTTPTADFGTSAVTGFGDPLPPGGTLAPHATATGTLVFSVPAAARVTWIQYAPNPNARGALYFDAA
ncbi:MAG: DUF4352 domain-containing protein [Thermomicrobia bacterium]|nr:DUF4352 domain-containing protein [Thermomicrobia bacterium]MCA1725649.1 DUF4352 domain-containing protein [Thermomicrobia bacterium]